METMALKGKPRDMNKWREVLLDPNVPFPGGASEYRRARNELLGTEAELRRLNEQGAPQRRALPPGGLIREDYGFESAADGSKVRFSELFAPGKNSLVIYNTMFGLSRQDAVRQPIEIRHELTEGFKKRLEHLSRSAPGKASKEKRSAAMTAYSTLVGALV